MKQLVSCESVWLVLDLSERHHIDDVAPIGAFPPTDRVALSVDRAGRIGQIQRPTGG